MTITGDPSRRHDDQARVAMARRLRARIAEIEAAILTRIQDLAPVEQNADPEYVHGLRAAIRAAIEYTMAAIESSEPQTLPIPIALLGQARLAARHGVALGTVLRRYNVGLHEISHFLLSEAKLDDYWERESLARLLGRQAMILDRVLVELEHEYQRETSESPRSTQARLVGLIKRALAGEPIDMSALNYSFDCHHIALITDGANAPSLLRYLSNLVDGRLLSVRPAGDVMWAWIGTRHRVDPAQLQVASSEPHLSSMRLALGEPDEGPLGWCRTHRQARETFPYVARKECRAIRYADIALQAAIERDDLASVSLRHIYIAPLQEQPDGTLLPTLRAYFAASRNAASAASVLKVSRQTVSKRLRSVEAVLNKPLEACCPDIEIALILHDSHDYP